MKLKIQQILVILFITLPLFQINAQNRTWDEGAGTGIWGTATNWAPNNVPDTNAENAVIDNGALGNYPVTDNDYNILGLTLSAPGASVTINSGNILTLDGDLIISDGTFNNDGILEVAGNMTLSGTGAYVSTGSTVFNGTTDLTTNTVNLGAITIDSGSSVTLLDDLSCSTITINGTLNTNGFSLTTTGDCNVSGTLDSSTVGGTVTIGGDFLVSGGSSTLANSLSAVNASFTGAGTVTANGAFNLSGNLSMSDGTLNGSGAIDVNGNVSLTNALADLSGDGRTINVAGDWDESAAVFTAGTGEVIFDGTTPSLTATNSFNNFTVAGVSVTLASAIDVNGALTITAGTLLAAGNQINVAGNWSNSGTFTHGGNLVVFDGAGSITAGGSDFNNVDITAGARTSGTAFTVTGLLDISGGSLTHSGGVLDAGTLTLSGGDLTVTNPGSLSVSTGDFTINNAASTYTGSGTVGVTPGDLLISAGSYTGSGALTAGADVSLSGGTFSPTGTTAITGDFLVSGGSSTLANSLSAVNASFTGAGTVTANGAFNLSGNLSMSAGTLTGTGAIDVNGNVSLTNALADLSGDGRTINVAGDWDESAAAFTAVTGTVIFDGTTPSLTATNSFNNFTVAGVSVTLASAIDVNGALTITAGTFLAAGNQINVAGNWSNSGTFTHGGNLVVFDGAGSITAGGSDFNNVDITAGARTSGAAVTVTGLLDISGGSLTHSAGVLDAGTLTLSGGNLTVNTTGSLSVSTGDFTINNAASAYTGSGTVGVTPGDLVISDGSYTGSGALTAGADVSLSGGTFSPTGTTAITGDFLVSGGSSTLANSLSAVNASFTGAGTVTANGAFNLSGNLSMSNGTLTGTGAIDVNGNVSLTNASATLSGTGRTINVAGDWDESAAVFTAGTGEVIFDGTTPSLTATNSFNNFTVAGVSVTLASAIDVNGALTITAGTLLAAGNQINVAGNWSNSGTFTHGGNLVVFDGAGSIAAGGSDFNNVDITAGARTSGAAVTVTGLLDISGGSLTHSAGVLDAGTLTLSGGDLTVTNPGSLSVSTGDFTINNAASAYTGSGAVGVTPGDLLISAGSYTGSGALTAGADVSLSGGTFSPTGTTAITGDFLVSGGSSTLANSLSAVNASFTGAGTVTANGAFNLSGNLSMSNGTLTGTGAIDVNGNVSLTNAAANLSGDGRTINVAGDWDESAAVFTAVTGTVIFDGTTPSLTATNSFNNFTVAGVSVTLASAIDVNGALTITAGTFLAAGNQINVAGNWSNSGTFTHGGNLVVFDGAGSITAGGSDFNNVDITAGARTSGAAVTVTGLLDISGGSLTHSGGVLDAGTLTLSGGNLTVNTTGSLSVSTGDFTINNAASAYTGSGAVGVTPGDLVISDGSYTGSGALTAGADVSLSGGTFSPTGTTAITGDFLVSGGSSTLANSLSAVNASFTGAGTVTANGAFALSGNLSMSAGTLTGTGAIDVNGNVSLTNASATLSGTGRTINVAGDWDESAAAFTAVTGTVIFDGTTPSLTATSSFNNFTVAGVSVTLASAIDVNGDLTITAGTLLASGNQINVAGNWSNSGTFTHGGNLVVFDGAGSITAGGSDFNNVDITAGARTSGAAVTVTGLLDISGGSLTHSAGVLDAGTLTLSGGDLTVTNPGSLSVSTGDFTINNAASAYTGSGAVGVTPGDLVISDGSYTGSGALTAGADVSLSGGTFSPTGTTAITGDFLVSGGSSTLANSLSAVNASFTGAGTVTANGAFALSGNLSMSAGTLTGTGAIDVNGNVSLTNASATLSGTGRTINVAGDWDESAAVFTAGTGEVIFDGTTPSLTATNSFNNFTVAGVSVTLASAIDVNGDLTITAGTLLAAGNQINVAGNWSNSGTFTHGGNLVVFDGAGSITAGGSDFNNVEIDGTAYTAGADITLDGTLTRTAGNLVMGANQLSVAGDVIYTSGTLTSTVIVTLNGGGAQDVDFTDTTLTNLTVNKAGGTATAGSDITLAGYFSNILGGFDLNDFEMTVTTDVIISAGTLSTGSGRINCGGDWQTAVGAVFDSGTGVVIFNGGGAQSLTTGGNDGNHDFYNIAVNKSGGTISVLTNDLLCRNFFHFAGTLNIAGRTVRTTGDFAVFGAGYAADNEWSAGNWTTDVFKYDPDPAFTRPAAIDAASASVLAIIDETVTHTAVFSDLDGATIRTDGNFYNNGADMPATVNWNLQIRDNSSGITFFAEAYGVITVTNSQVALNPLDGTIGNIAAAEGVTATGCSAEWKTTRTTIAGAGTYTVYDDVIRVEFDELIENTNDEISAAVADIFLTAYATSFTGTYTDAECTISTDTVDDIDTFYIRITTNPWNTDAQNASLGNVSSTDRDGTHQTNIPQIHFRKHFAGLYQTLRDQYKNRLDTTDYITVTDKCPPVLVSITADRDAGTAQAYNYHNYFQLKYSEPVNLGTAAGFTIADATASNVRAQPLFDDSASGKYGGSIEQSGADVDITGFFTYAASTVNKGSKDGTPEVNSLYRANTGGAANSDSTLGIRIFIAGYSTGADPDQVYPGYLWGVTDPVAKAVTVPANNFITDASGNILEHTAGSAYPKIAVSVAGAGWDVDQPVISAYSPGAITGPYNEILTRDTDTDNLIDRLEIHIHDNSADDGTWDSTADHPDPTAGEGLRDTSVTSSSTGFTINSTGNTTVRPASGFSFLTAVENSLFKPTLPYQINVKNDMYFSISFNDSELPLNYLTQLILSYDSSVGFITDLSGNLLYNETNINCYEQVPPGFTYTLSIVGDDKIFVKFSEYVYGQINPPHATTDPVDAADFTIPGYTISGVDRVERAPDNIGTLTAFINVDSAITANDAISLSITPFDGASVFDALGTPMDAAEAHRITDIGIGIIEPVWADDSIESENIQIGGTLKYFDGTGKLHDSDITLEANILASNAAGFPVNIFYDANVPSSYYWNDIWLPALIPGFNPAGNTSARGSAAYSSSGTLRTFLIPENDSEMTAGKRMDFIFRVGDLFCARVANPDDPRTVIPWSVKIEGVKEQRSGVTILNNVINPLKGEKTVLSYDLKKRGGVTINIFSLSGDVVKTLYKGTQPAGSYSFTWDGKNSGGRVVARGIYFIRVVGPGISEYRKVLVVK